MVNSIEYNFSYLDENIDVNPLAHDLRNHKSNYRIFGSIKTSF